jgi:hypothetical protein
MTYPKIPDKDGTEERHWHNTNAWSERARTVEDLHTPSRSPTTSSNYQTPTNTGTTGREYAPLDDLQKRSQAAEGRREVDRFVKEIQEWLEWDAEYADSQLVHGLSIDTVRSLSSIQEVLTMCNTDDEMENGEHDDADQQTGHFFSPWSGPTKENENLAETVRNMSRTNVILAEENRTLKAHIAHSSRTQPPALGDTGLEDSIHAPAHLRTFTKSANPNPIVPGRKAHTHTRGTPTDTPRSQPTAPTQRHHKSRLVIHFTPRLDQKLQTPGSNRSRDQRGPPQPHTPGPSKRLRQRHDHFRSKRNPDCHSRQQLHRSRPRTPLHAHLKDSSRRGAIRFRPSQCRQTTI